MEKKGERLGRQNHAGETSQSYGRRPTGGNINKDKRKKIGEQKGEK